MAGAHVPAGYTGDATAQIEAQIERFAAGFRERILARSTRSVAQSEAHNANYLGGDVVTGSRDALQLVFRPRVALDPYSTGSPGFTSARRRRLPAPAPTACAAATPHARPCDGSTPTATTPSTLTFTARSSCQALRRCRGAEAFGTGGSAAPGRAPAA